MDKQIVTQAITELERDKQETKINEVKKIVSSYLEQIAKQEVIVKNEQQKLKLYKKDLDDLKAGRLDKIEDRQINDPLAKGVSVVVIRRIQKDYMPLQPWRSSYDWTVGGNTTLKVSGTFCQNFVSGSYKVGNKIINF